MSADLNVSLERHLLHRLYPLPQIVPEELAEKLRSYLNDPPPSTIPHSVLQAVSQWSRTTTGIAALNSSSPSLDPHAYSMISLLAGAMTSPEGKFGEYVPRKRPEQLEAEKNKERKTITALINALLSIGGAAFATWWAAEKTGWRNEYRVLLALFVAIIVAASEAILYLIWQARQASRSKRTRHGITSASHKKDDGDLVPEKKISDPVGEVMDEKLRRRR